MNQLALPPAFKARMQVQLGDEAESFEQSLASEAPVSIRYNPHKSSEPLINDSVVWCPNATY